MSGIETALIKARQARRLVEQNFPQPIDPVGAEVGSLRKHAGRLVEFMETWIAKSRQ